MPLNTASFIPLYDKRTQCNTSENPKPSLEAPWKLNSAVVYTIQFDLIPSNKVEAQKTKASELKIAINNTKQLEMLRIYLVISVFCIHSSLNATAGQLL